MAPQAHIDRFYKILDRNLHACGAFPLSSINSLKSNLELRGGGVYFAFEPGELRQNGTASRVVRIGKAGSLYNRSLGHALMSDK